MLNSHKQFANIKDARVLAESDDVEWHHSADVVVVGLGGAGVSAALEACENGASVIAIDRFQGGGDTALSGGVLYAGGGTRFQKEASYDDDPDNMFNYLQQEVEGIVQDSTLRQFCEQSVNNVDWLQKNGVIFKSTLSPVKTSYPGRKYYLYYSGNESVPSYVKHARPVPRGHRAVGKGLSGSAFFEPLKASALSKGVTFLSQSRVVRLLVDENQAVIGVELSCVSANASAEHRKKHELFERWRTYLPGFASKLRKRVVELEAQNPQTIFVRARNGVILSTGGFVSNRPMVNHYAPKYKDCMPLGTTGTDGSGINLGESVGGATNHMANVSAWRFINPPMSWAKGVLVNMQGERFVNEQCYGAVIGKEMCERNDGKAYLIINKSMYYRSLRQAFPDKVWLFQALPAYLCMLLGSKKSKTIAGLAQKIGLPEDVLTRTLKAYNLAASGEQEDMQGKSLDFMQSMNEGPYYAFKMSAKNPFFPLPTITLGGLRVKEATGQVCDEQGGVIRGLYAAGRTAVGIPTNSYVSGLSIADCVFSGRRAGNHAASNNITK